MLSHPLPTCIHPARPSSATVVDSDHQLPRPQRERLPQQRRSALLQLQVSRTLAGAERKEAGDSSPSLRLALPPYRRVFRCTSTLMDMLPFGLLRPLVPLLYSQVSRAQIERVPGASRSYPKDLLQVRGAPVTVYA